MATNSYGVDWAQKLSDSGQMSRFSIVSDNGTFAIIQDANGNQRFMNINGISSLEANYPYGGQATDKAIEAERMNANAGSMVNSNGVLEAVTIAPNGQRYPISEYNGQGATTDATPTASPPASAPAPTPTPPVTNTNPNASSLPAGWTIDYDGHPVPPASASSPTPVASVSTLPADFWQYATKKMASDPEFAKTMGTEAGVLSAYNTWKTPPDEAPAISPDKTKDEYANDVVTVYDKNGNAITVKNDPNTLQIYKDAGYSPTDPGTNGTAPTYAASLPDSAYTAPAGYLTPGTSEYQAALDKIDTLYYDNLEKALTATTEQQKTSADDDWQQLKTSIEKTLGVTLANDAIGAWDQIKTLGTQYKGQGLTGSGFQAEDMDNYLNKLRAQEDTTRDTSQTGEDAKMKAYYRSYATSAQVAALIASDPAKAQAWGLVPSDSMKASLTPAAIKTANPNATDDQINKYIASVVDENGNYRSSLYQQYLYGQNLGVDTGKTTTTYNADGTVAKVTVAPGDTGLKDIEEAKTEYGPAQIGAQNSQTVAAAAEKNASDAGVAKGTVNTSTFITPPVDPNAPTAKIPPTPANPTPEVPTTKAPTLTPEATKNAAAAAANLGGSATSSNFPSAAGTASDKALTIKNLSVKSSSGATWSDKDLANWNFATNKQAVPKGTTVNSGGSIVKY